MKVKQKEYMVDEAHEYLNNQYDQEIEDFYFEAREDAGIKICERSFLGWFINIFIIIK